MLNDRCCVPYWKIAPYRCAAHSRCVARLTGGVVNLWAGEDFSDRFRGCHNGRGYRVAGIAYERYFAHGLDACENQLLGDARVAAVIGVLGGNIVGQKNDAYGGTNQDADHKYECVQEMSIRNGHRVSFG